MHPSIPTYGLASALAGGYASIDNYCLAYPLDPVISASFRLIEELTKRKQ
jgi:hypothetical protein